MVLVHIENVHVNFFLFNDKKYNNETNTKDFCLIAEDVGFIKYILNQR